MLWGLHSNILSSTSGFVNCGYLGRSWQIVTASSITKFVSLRNVAISHHCSKWHKFDVHPRDSQELPRTSISTRNQMIMPPSVSLKYAPKPEWLKVRAPGGENYLTIKSILRKLTLHTVCEEAHCPNMSECWGGGTATFMLMGDTCTRACHFCHVTTGKPGVLLISEPIKVAQAICSLGLTYVVLTSVNRDDLTDGGADHFARTVEAIKRRSPEILVEVLIPDFKAEPDALKRIVGCGADVVAHNIETVERLTPKVRDRRATYRQSLRVLGVLKELSSRLYTKSSIMAGFGETDEEISKTMDDLRTAGVDILTLGQYLRPSTWHLPVVDYVPPIRFESWKDFGDKKGFLYVASGPLVRSSYKAGEMFLEGLKGRKKAQKNDGEK